MSAVDQFGIFRQIANATKRGGRRRRGGWSGRRQSCECPPEGYALVKAPEQSPQPVPPAQQQQRPGHFWQAVTKLTPTVLDRLSGVPMQFPPPPGFGQVVHIGPDGYAHPAQPMPAQAAMQGYDPYAFGAAGFDDFDDDDEFDDDDDDGSEAAVDQFINGFGGYHFGKVNTDRLEARIERIEDKIERLRDKNARGGPFVNHRRLSKRIRRLGNKRKRLMKKLRRAKERIAQTEAEASEALAPMQQSPGSLAAAAAAGATEPGNLVTPAGTRQAITQGYGKGMALLDPQIAMAQRKSLTAQGLRYSVAAPPGSGKLVPIPMFASGSDIPRNEFTIPVSGVAPSVELTTEDLPFAVIRIVGFIASTRGTAAGNGSIGTVQDLKIRGGTNLFLHERAAPADNYDTGIKALRGLRDYPTVTSPNTISVTAGAAGQNTDTVILTCSAVVDILTDDTYGPGQPGPYAG